MVYSLWAGLLRQGEVTAHIKGAEHKKNAERMKQGVTRPGHCAEVKSPQQVESGSSISTLQLPCKGQNQSVEHSELGNEVINVLNYMGVPLKKVIAFVSDSAAVLKTLTMQS